MACCFFFMGRRGELRINDNYFLETKIRATPYKNIKKSRNCVKTIIVNSRIYLFNDNRDNIPLESTSSSGKEYYYQQLKQLYLTTCFASNNTARDEVTPRMGKRKNEELMPGCLQLPFGVQRPLPR